MWRATLRVCLKQVALQAMRAQLVRFSREPGHATGHWLTLEDSKVRLITCDFKTQNSSYLHSTEHLMGPENL